MEKDILYNAIESFSSNLKTSSFSNNIYDDKLHLSINCSNIDFIFQVTKNLTFSKLHKIRNNLSMSQGNIILISDYIPKALKEHLKKENICYLDTAGNAFITNNKDVFIYLENNKNSQLSSERSNRAFSKSGLKVIYQFLIKNDALNMSYREIGKISKVSIHTVGKVIKELLRDGYIIQINKKKFKIKEKGRLLEDWITVFNKVLRPKLKQRNFKPVNFKINELLSLAPPESIGGELSAESLSNYLIAEKAILYTDKPFVDVAMELRLIPADEGAITLIEKFWNNTETGITNKLVHPILVYADLLNDTKPRNIETAKIIYDKYVKNII